MTKQKEHPILFSGDMVRAILKGGKTVTRRVPSKRYPSWKKGEYLWVRETFYAWGHYSRINSFVWDKQLVLFPDQITSDTPHIHSAKTETGWHKRPSIFMPRWASRITLRLTADVYEKPLQSISHEDCIDEGIISTRFWNECKGETIKPHEGDGEASDKELSEAYDAFVKEVYRDLWDSINASRGFPWASNPTVAVIRFEVVK